MVEAAGVCRLGGWATGSDVNRKRPPLMRLGPQQLACWRPKDAEKHWGGSRGVDRRSHRCDSENTGDISMPSRSPVTLATLPMNHAMTRLLKSPPLQPYCSLHRQEQLMGQIMLWVLFFLGGGGYFNCSFSHAGVIFAVATTSLNITTQVTNALKKKTHLTVKRRCTLITHCRGHGWTETS